MDDQNPFVGMNDAELADMARKQLDGEFSTASDAVAALLMIEAICSPCAKPLTMTDPTQERREAVALVPFSLIGSKNPTAKSLNESAQVIGELQEAGRPGQDALSPKEIGARTGGTIAHVSTGRSELAALIMSALKPTPQPTDEAVRGLVETIESRIGQDFYGECRLTEAEARQIIARLQALTPAWQGIAERALKSLRALQEGAAIALAAWPTEEGTVPDFLSAIHREAVKGQLAGDGVINAAAPRPTTEAS